MHLKKAFFVNLMKSDNLGRMSYINGIVASLFAASLPEHDLTHQHDREAVPGRAEVHQLEVKHEEPRQKSAASTPHEVIDHSNIWLPYAPIDLDFLGSVLESIKKLCRGRGGGRSDSILLTKSVEIV